MDDPIRIDETGKPLNDTWSNYGRRHCWIDWKPVHEEGVEPEHMRVRVECLRCHQFRLVWHRAPVSGFRWGCPRVPFLYRLRLWLQGKDIPAWSVNSRPPWLRDHAA